MARDPLNRANHYGSQPISSVRELETRLNSKQPASAKLKAIDEAQMLYDAEYQIPAFTSVSHAVMRKVGMGLTDILDRKAADQLYQPAGGGGSVGGSVSGGLGDIAKSDTRSSLAAVSGAEHRATRWLAEDGRQGIFQASTDAADAAKALIDTAGGIYVAGSGVTWVRKFDGPVNPLWFGIVEGNASGANGTANSVAWLAMLAALRGRAVNASAFYQGLEWIRFPTGYFEFALTSDITDGTLTLEGTDTGFPAGRGTVLKFPAGVTGIRVQRYNTSGATTTDSPTHRGGDGAIIRNLTLRGAYTNTEAEAHGIHLRARASIENVYIESFEGDGIFSTATAGGGAQEGNSNNVRITGGRIQWCRNGISIDGADTNVWAIIGIDCSANREWGFKDSSFLGNSYFSCHADADGVSSGGSPSACVTYSGNRYGVIAGQEAAASTNAPSGTTDNNTYWYYIGAGGVHANFPVWASGTAYRAGGSYFSDNVNARNFFGGCYHESGQGLAQLVAPSLAMGGNLEGSTYGTGGNAGTSITGYVKTKHGWQAELADSTSTRRVMLGERGVKTTLLQFEDTVSALSVWRLKFDSANNLRLDYANGGAAVAFHISGNVTTSQFGTGAAVPYAFYAPRLAVGADITNARILSNGTAAPTTGAHGQGEIVLNRTPSVGSPVGWICITAGTPGTWHPFGVVGALPAIQSVTSAATVTPTFLNDAVNVTAQAAALALANWSGTARDFWGLVVRIRDNGTARAISYGSNYLAADGVTLPTTTVVGKTHEIAFVHNEQTGKHVAVAVMSY
jgi:hypothetical protein